METLGDGGRLDGPTASAVPDPGADRATQPKSLVIHLGLQAPGGLEVQFAH